MVKVLCFIPQLQETSKVLLIEILVILVQLIYSNEFPESINLSCSNYTTEIDLVLLRVFKL